MNTDENQVIERLVRWASEQPPVRALLLTSSRANPNAKLDRLSDYDVVVVASDFDHLSGDEAWLRAYGTPLVHCRDSYPCCGVQVQTRLVLYEDGTKIDYSLWPVELLKEVIEESRLPDGLDIGYRVLLDKDGLTADLKPPTFGAHIPRRPSEADYLSLVEEFWFETGYVAKNLWRDELFPAKYSFDAVIKFNLLRRMLEWYIELDHDWSAQPGFMGRGFKSLLKPDVWAEVESTFVGAGTQENWDALFRTAELFRTVAQAVATQLGYRYPEGLDRGVMTYLARIKDLERDS
jgi:aminoglycoside 6-adenylyltransferase